MTVRTFRTVLVALLVFGLARPAVSAPRLVPGVEVLHATGPKLLVLVAPLDAPARSQAGLLEHVAETAVKSQGRFVLLRSADALDGRAARARQEAAEKARKLDKEGRQKLDDLDAVAGAQVLGEAVAAWRASDLTEHFKDLVTTWSTRGGAYATGDENVKARQDIERILAVAPDAQFSNAWYPPDLLKYAEERRKQAMSSTGELTVRSEPVGARIWVDGVYRGVAPATVKGLPNGKHLVTALLAGRSMLMSEVALGEEVVKLEPAEGAAHWSRTLDKVAKDPNGEGRDTAARELAAATGAEQVLLLVAKKSVNGNQLDITGVRIEANDGHNAAWVQKVVPMDATEATDGLVLSLLEKDAPRANGKPVTHFKAFGLSTHRVVGIAVMGGGAALAITGAIFGGLALGKQAEFQSTVQTDTFAATQIANDGRTFAVICDITLITGLVAAAAGAVLGFTPVGDILFKPKSDALPPPEEKPAPKEEKAKKKEESAPPPKKEKKDDAVPLKKDEPKKDEKKEEPKKEEEPKKTKKQEAEEKKKREAEEKKAREEEEKRQKEDEKRAKEEEEKRKKEEKKGSSKKKEDEEAAKKKEEEEAAKKKADEEAAKKKEEEAKKKKAEEEAAKKKAEEDAARKKKAEEEKKKKADEDHDDLKNY